MPQTIDIKGYLRFPVMAATSILYCKDLAGNAVRTLTALYFEAYKRKIIWLDHHGLVTASEHVMSRAPARRGPALEGRPLEDEFEIEASCLLCCAVAPFLGLER
jgi:hypothetical protein